MSSSSLCTTVGTNSNNDNNCVMTNRNIITTTTDNDDTNNDNDNDTPQQKQQQQLLWTKALSQHCHFAARRPAGTPQPLLLSKNGMTHSILLPSPSPPSSSTMNRPREMLSVGLASSECFSGGNLYRILHSGFVYESHVMSQLAASGGSSSSLIPPLSIHTSGGVPLPLSDFISAMARHLPWSDLEEDDDDWFLSLQSEGASAVMAGVDILYQLQILATSTRNRRRRHPPPRSFVAVGERSYHGPPSTSLGSQPSIFSSSKRYQIIYPVPLPGHKSPEDDDEFYDRFCRFLKQYGSRLAVLLVEPQSGSSMAGLPWPRGLLRRCIATAQEYGVFVMADEIMCGLGRHGCRGRHHSSLFLSGAWELNVDAVTFGKAIAGGVYPLSGVIIKKGRRRLCEEGRTVLQSHTLAGSSVRALLAGAMLLRLMTEEDWLTRRIPEKGIVMKDIFETLELKMGGMVICHGQGLLWGCLFVGDDEAIRQRRVAACQRHCEDVGVLPYFVPSAGGFTVTPLFDVSEEIMREMGRRLEEALVRTLQEEMEDML